MAVEKKDDERETNESSSEQVVDPWEVSSKLGVKIDYDKLIDKFGCQRIDQSLIDRVERLTRRQPHVFLRRGIFFVHRDFNGILDAYESGDKFYISLQRKRTFIRSFAFGPFNSFLVYQILARSFHVPLVIQLTDDEKCIWKKLPLEETQRLAWEKSCSHRQL